MAKKSNTLAAIKPDEEWQAESDLRTLTEAEAIKRDAKRFKRATAMAKKRLLELASVAGEAGETD